ncbi:MAG: hypothetical protein EOO73_11980 [Myxococcales bacterium]|nr:MAG: hypothetical protein EOO73_11980 [Myxococcales bacterium]
MEEEATGRLSQGFLPNDERSEEQPSAAAALKDRLEDKAQGALSYARGAAERRKDEVAEKAEGVAQAIHHASTKLRSAQHEELSRYTDEVASKLEQLASSLKGRDLGSLLGEVTRFARRQPALFLGGAFTTGLIAARFVRSSARQSHPSGPSDQSQSAFDHARSVGMDGGPMVGDERDSADLQREVALPSGFGPAPGGYGPASAPAGAHGGSGTFGAEGAGGGPGNDPSPVAAPPSPERAQE